MSRRALMYSASSADMLRIPTWSVGVPASATRRMMQAWLYFEPSKLSLRSPWASRWTTDIFGNTSR